MESTTPKKRPLLKAIKGLFNIPIVRGAIKSIPFGNLGYEIVETVQYFIDKKRGRIAPETKPPHDPISQLLQLAGIICLLYAFFNKWVSIEDVLKWTGIDNTGITDPIIKP